MKPKTLAMIASAVLAATPVSGAPIKLDLTFSGVTATFFGLDDAFLGSQSASFFDFSGALDSYTNVTAPFFSNSFKFNATGFESALFSYDGSHSGDANSGNTLISLSCKMAPGTRFDFCSFEELTPSGVQVSSSETATTTIRPVTPVPIPASGMLLLFGVAGIAALSRRREHAS